MDPNIVGRFPCAFFLCHLEMKPGSLIPSHLRPNLLERKKSSAFSFSSLYPPVQILGFSLPCYEG